MYTDLATPQGGREVVSKRPSAQVTHIEADLRGGNKSNKDIANNRENIFKKHSNHNKIK